MDLELKGKTAIVTGGSRGIGRAIAVALADEGMNVAISARGEERLREAEAEIRGCGVEALGVQADMATAEGVEALIGGAIDRFGRIDVLVNNVGGGTQDEDDAAWLQAIQQNLLSAARATRLVVPEMRKIGGGSIIHIASIYGREAGGGITYNAAKAALISHAKNMALRLAPEGIRVNAIAPGSIMFPGGSWDRRRQADPDGIDDFMRRSIAAGRFGTLEEVANVAVFLASPRSSWIIGACINVDGGQSRSNI